MQLSQLQQLVQDQGYGSDTAAIQLDFINAAYREIHSRERWPFLEAVDQTSATVVGTASSTPPMTTWRNVDAVRLDLPASQDFFDIDYMEPQDLFDKLHRDPLTLTTPQYWTMYANQTWFYPAPDQTYRISYYYINEPADLVNPTDVPLIPVAFHDVLVAGAICRMAYRERDWIGLELWTTKYEQLATRLEEEYLLRQRQTSSEVKRSGWWNTYAPYPLTSTGF